MKRQPGRLAEAPLKAFVRLAFVVVLAFSAGAALAQPLQVLADGADAQLLACLQPSRDALPPLPYPADELLRKREATVRVRMEFTLPDGPPKATVFFNQGGDAFSEAVLQRVGTYRLPCLPAGRAEPFVVTQEFQFDPRDGRPVIWSAARCGLPTLAPNHCSMSTTAKPIDYPTLALGGPLATTTGIVKRTQSGAVLALMEAESAQLPPKVSILHDAGSRSLSAEVEEYLRAARLRCDRYPVSALQVFHFQIDGDDQFSLKDMPLKTFIAQVRDLDRHKVRFDFSTMRCPFDVQLHLYQPYFENSVGEVGDADPNRADFLAWLREVALKLPRNAASHLVGATTRVSVPCGSLDLRD